MEKISIYSLNLKHWAQRKFHSLPNQIKNKRAELANLQNHNCWQNEASRILHLENEVEKLNCQEELYWRQRSRVNWLAGGDKNTKFFHRTATVRHTLNNISGLVSKQGDMIHDFRGMSEIIHDYFAELFTSNNPFLAMMHPVLDNIESSVTSDMNYILCAPFSVMEIIAALFGMNPDKAPRPDGMSTLFYQKYWHIIGGDVTREILAFLNEDAPLGQWNHTIIKLIPKVENPLMLKEFRPISLCNVCYKIIAHAMTNRLRPLMKIIIDESQCAFVPGRLITDNVLLGFEATHWMRNRKKGKQGFAALKLDMSKAYDRVEWSFLEAIMDKVGFHRSWTSKVMHCVSSVSYSFALNQTAVGSLKPSRGIRQGDPLSPYLFALCAQGLSSMLSAYENRGFFKGIRIASSCPVLTHVFFADDSLIFFRATVEDCTEVKLPWLANFFPS